MMWIYDPFNTYIDVIESEYFRKDKKKIYLLRDKNRLNRMINDLKKGFIFVDNGTIKDNYGDKTHLLLNLSSEENGYLVYSKHLSEYDRLTYRVYKPIELSNDESLKYNKKYKMTIELNNFLGHKFNGKEYYELK